MKQLIITLCLLLLSFPAVADDWHTYDIRQMRAAPGQLPVLIDLIEKADWAAMERANPTAMRHSQGDQWDIMLLSPSEQSCKTDSCDEARKAFNQNVQGLANYDMVMRAKSKTDWPTLETLGQDAGLYHIEMFHAAAGQHAALYEEREMENAYLVATQRKANVIFNVVWGSDVDNFTVGYHDNMQAFAWSPDLPTEVFEKAATDAGFKNRADISFRLRELIVSHHDTIAGKLR